MSLFSIILRIVNIVIDILPLVRFRRNKYFVYFCVVALIDPLHFVLVHFFKINSYAVIPFIGPVLLLAMPKREIKQIIFSLLSLIILFPHLGESKIIPLMITMLNVAYIIFLLCEDLFNEIKIKSLIPVFLPVLILETLRGAINFYFYYENLQMLTKIYQISTILGMIFTILIVYFGPERKIKYSFNKREDEIECNNENINPELQNSHLVQFTGSEAFRGLTNMETKVLYLLAEGHSNKEIAETLFVSSRTVYFHINNLKDKLQIDKTNHLIKFAIENRELIMKMNKPAQSDSKTE